MSATLLNKLKELKYERSDSSPFKKHTEFQIWADSVIPLLAFNPKLQIEFKNAATSVELYRGEESSEVRVECINRAIGILNQAITLLENPINKHEQAKIEAPEKLTIKWLYQHAPISFYVWFFGIIGSSFMLGLNFYDIFSAIQTKSHTSAQIITVDPPNKEANEIINVKNPTDPKK